MKWYEKFRVGQEVRVIKKVITWHFENFIGHGMAGRGASWVYDMDKTIGKVLEIVEIDKDVGYRLDTIKEFGYNYWYPVEALQESVLVGEQLLFGFMNKE